ncbi:hypothetical protein ACI78R_17985 [Geodermatophilus sp. SYSU D01106]
MTDTTHTEPAPTPVATTPTAAPAPAHWGRADQVLLGTLVTVLVLTQRIGVPVGDTSISVALPLSYAVIVVLGLRRALAVGRLRLELLVVAMTSVLAVTAYVSYTGGTLSITSLLLLVVIYLPWVLRARTDRGREVVEGAGRAFVRVMLVLATVGIGQFVTQLLGVWDYEDYLGEWVSPQFLIADYNTSIPLAYGVDVFKSNAFLMLEPSAFSQFCALAALIGLLLGVRAWQLLVLVAGLASAVSGTGIILLGVGLVLMALHAPRRLRPAHLLAVAVIAVLALLSPAGPLLLDRTDEINQPQSSGYARFVAPYSEVYDGLAADPVRYLVGAGPGNVERLLASARDGLGNDVLYSIIPKLAFEYGILAGGLFVVFLVLTLLDRPAWRVVPGSVLVMVFLLSGALLQPQTAFIAWLLTGLGSRDSSASAPERGAEAGAG